RPGARAGLLPGAIRTRPAFPRFRGGCRPHQCPTGTDRPALSRRRATARTPTTAASRTAGCRPAALASSYTPSVPGGDGTRLDPNLDGGNSRAARPGAAFAPQSGRRPKGRCSMPEEPKGPTPQVVEKPAERPGEQPNRPDQPSNPPGRREGVVCDPDARPEQLKPR